MVVQTLTSETDFLLVYSIQVILVVMESLFIILIFYEMEDNSSKKKSPKF